MNNKSLLVLIIITLLSISTVLISCQNSSENHVEVEYVTGTKGFAEYMYFMQLYTQKLLLSVQSENRELADFYHHELEEVTEDVIEHIQEYDGFPVGELTEAMLLHAMDNFEDALDADELNWDEIRHRARLIVRSCNACHEATAHGYIRIPEEATINPFLQDFDPTE